MQSLIESSSASPVESAIFHSDLSNDERIILTELLTQNDKSIALSITPSITQDELTGYFDIAGKAHKRLGDAISTLKPIIGQLLVTVQNRPEIWKSMGFRSFDDFLTNGATVMTKMSRPSLYECLRVAKAFPSLEIERYDKIGSGKMSVLVKVTSENNSNCEELLKAAENPEVTVNGLRDIVAEKGLGEPAVLKTESLRIICDQAVKLEFEEMLNDDTLKHGLGINTPSALLQALMADAKGSLYSQAMANLNVDVFA
jgi:hypothetical protein